MYQSLGAAPSPLARLANPTPESESHLSSCAQSVAPLDLNVSRTWILTTGLVRKFPRAGARLAFVHDAYELRIPDRYDAATPAAVFTVERHHQAYAGDVLPTPPTTSPRNTPYIIPKPAQSLNVLFRSPACPTTLDEFLHPNTIPLLPVHLVVYENRTLIGVTAPHIAFDAVGMGVLLHAWTRVLTMNGGDVEGIPGMPWDAQPFAGEAFAEGAKAAPHGWFDVQGDELREMIEEFVGGLARDPEEVVCWVRVPKKLLEEKKREIMAELKAKGSEEYVGSSDVLAAWWIKTLHGQRAPTDPTPIHIQMPKDLRDLPIYANSAPLPYPYIHNTCLFVSAPPLPVSAIQTQSLGALALHVRRGIQAYTGDPEKVRREVRWVASEEGRRKWSALMPCPPKAEAFSVTNWRTAKLGELDFAGARVAKAGEAADECKRKVSLVHIVVSSKEPASLRGINAVPMEDDEAVWLWKIFGVKELERLREGGGIDFA
ncbi:hypothetical protein R3P38DRAFT_2872885 [Favolaschia claudopus]|uniref:Uncharacterized protein n=1 Tax=Favolaschia claudopus TaxID=2862362 RepID=A0AAW0DAD1_9AGAR